ncbi:hypothetical protein LguiB_034369 [Lonicera macranthoides]
MEHMLGYWNKSQKRPDKKLFIKYEGTRADVTFHTKKLAKFTRISIFPKRRREKG